MLLSGALFCNQWNISWFSAFGVGRREVLLPRSDVRMFQGFDYSRLVDLVSM
jgi:hypothetical protein